MISRVADHCFWLGRYLERASATARLLGVTEQLALDAGLPPEDLWPPVLIVVGERGRFTERYAGWSAASDRDSVLSYLTWDPQCPVSLTASIESARSNAAAIRETISLEMWQAINELWVWSRTDGRADWDDNHHDYYARVSRELTLVFGELRATMLREDPFRFVTLGTMLERAGQTARILDVYHHALDRALSGRDTAGPSASHHTGQPRPLEAVDVVLLWGLLRACQASEPFMKRYHGRVSAQRVAEFLLLDETMPRSVRFALDTAAGQLDLIRDDPSSPGGRSVARLSSLRDRLTGASTPDEMHALLTHVVDQTSVLCVTLGEELFGYEAVGDAPVAASQSQ